MKSQGPHDRAIAGFESPGPIFVPLTRYICEKSITNETGLVLARVDSLTPLYYGIACVDHGLVKTSMTTPSLQAIMDSFFEVLSDDRVPQESGALGRYSTLPLGTLMNT